MTARILGKTEEAMHLPIADLTYVLPIRRMSGAADVELAAYLTRLAAWVAVVVVDGSPEEVFALHRQAWPASIVHIPVDADRKSDLNGKVAGVVTGLRRVTTPKAVVADDDVRYDPFSLRALAVALDDADIVRPQNVFAPPAWHTLLDTGRVLIARATGGDWPGTVGVRLAVYERTGGYDGNVLFENLELVRTMRAVGGRERVASDLFVERQPPTARHYAAQRVRQAYDEFARPGRLAAELVLAPAIVVAARRFGPVGVGVLAVGAIALAEAGRRRDGASRVFPVAASALAPLWVLERSVTSWCAIALRVSRGGVRYGHGRLRVAANSDRVLRARLQKDAA